jgi:hypothetical protein
MKQKPRIYVSYFGTKYQMFHFEKPPSCCGKSIFASPSLADCIDEYEHIFKTSYGDYVHDFKRPSIKFFIKWDVQSNPDITNHLAQS